MGGLLVGVQSSISKNGPNVIKPKSYHWNAIIHFLTIGV
jgi:hypothetical protein